MPPERSHAEASRLRARQRRIAKRDVAPVRLLRGFTCPVAMVRYGAKLGALPLMLAVVAISLATFAPIVVHDADERFPLAPASRSSDTRPTVYARAVPSRRGGEWLQYWLFYAGQDQDRGIFRT